MPDALLDMVKTAEQRAHSMDSLIREFMFAIPKVRGPILLTWNSLSGHLAPVSSSVWTIADAMQCQQAM